MIVGVVAGLAVLARVDGLLLVALLAVVQLWRGRWRELVPAGVAGAVVVAPWWIWSKLLVTAGPMRSGERAMRFSTS